MEFPGLGGHCAVKTCNRLDFLPMKCDSCSSIFCKDHIKYDEHQCPSSYRKNIQIPICPLCNQDVPYEYRDQSPDRVVSAHIDRDCKSDPALKKRTKVYTNKCSVPLCKQREAIQVKCDKCLRTYCLRHRFPDDHKCQTLEKQNRNESDQDTAVASAMKLSLNQRTQEENDYLLAKALQESEREEAQRRRTTILELDWKSPGKKNPTKKLKNTEKNISPMKSDESTNSKPEDNKLLNEIDEFDNDDALTSNNITVSSFRSAVGKPKTTEKRLIDMNTVIANIERQQQEDERLRQGMNNSSVGKS
ncbi:unnamed protein product [Rotaria socialis]|uniref:AN1-type domain-containing protein n=1 Tax=Rotaria socialis TaxID=392032 RepID=A0A821RDY5_9BILA|nr:unnamed protein product [Rotaria socialis]